MSANSNLTCVTFRHHLLQLQHFGRGSIRHCIPVFHTDSPNASVGSWPASLIESKGLWNTLIPFSHVVCSQLSFIIWTSLSTLDPPGARQTEVRIWSCYTTEQSTQTLHSVDIIAQFGQLPNKKAKSPQHALLRFLKTRCLISSTAVAQWMILALIGKS